jgi:hypothetical protein
MIDKFEKNKRFLSNFWECEVYSVFDDIVYKSVEHAFQAAKTNIKEEKEAIRNCTTPGQAKRMGKIVTLRPDWEENKLVFMESFVRQKFITHQELLALLLATGNEELIEGNTWGDVFWGVCNGIGENHLGKILMKVRDVLRSS